MRRWDPINARQHALLTRIAGGDDVDVTGEGLTMSLRALRDRGLVEARYRHGRWETSASDAGAFYLRHGYHPDRLNPAGGMRASQSDSGSAPPSTRRGASDAKSDLLVKPLKPATQREVKTLYDGPDVPKLAFTLQQAATAASVSISMLTDAIHGRHKLLPPLPAKRAGDRYLISGLELLRWIDSLPDA